MKFATWNVNSLGVRLPQVQDWLLANPVDVLALQEIKMQEARFPFEALAQAGYTAHCLGQKSYNGVALLSRTPATDVVKNIPGFADDMARVISAKVQGVRVIGAYFPCGQIPGSDKFDYKMAWLKRLRDWVQSERLTHPKLVLMGDFNITFDDADVWDPVVMKDQICCTDLERGHLRALVDLGLHDAFRLFEQPAKSYSWWDYRDFSLQRNRGMRIDHILVSSELQSSVSRCWIDKTPRKHQRPSDHAPVVVEMNKSDTAPIGL